MRRDAKPGPARNLPSPRRCPHLNSKTERQKEKTNDLATFPAPCDPCRGKVSRGQRNRGERRSFAAALAITTALAPSFSASAELRPLRPGAEAWAESGLGGIRGLTIGPIENLRHPDRGYGTEACARAMDEAAR